jgi:hypothetical protein
MVFVWLLGMAMFAGIVWTLVVHWDYYELARLQRPLHENHFLLRPSGSLGLLLGLLAVVLFGMNLGYLVRKQLITVTWLGPLRCWMDAHVLTGLIGMGLVGLHSALAPCSALGILAVVAMAVTVFTGIVGRTIYIQVPRSLEGRELELKQVQNQLNACQNQLRQVGVQADWLQLPRPQGGSPQTGLLGCFWAMAVGDHQRRRDYRGLKRRVLNSPELRPAAAQILPLARAFCIHWQWFVRYHELRNLIASWRFFHRWLAVLMFCVVIGHIVLAVQFGDLTVWGGAR